MVVLSIRSYRSSGGWRAAPKVIWGRLCVDLSSFWPNADRWTWLVPVCSITVRTLCGLIPPPGKISILSAARIINCLISSAPSGTDLCWPLVRMRVKPSSINWSSALNGSGVTSKAR